MKNWTVETLGKIVDDEIAQLPLDMRGRFVRVSSLIEEFGPFQLACRTSGALAISCGRFG